MTIFTVEYETINKAKFFGGSNNYYEKRNEYFSTEEKANNFINELDKKENRRINIREIEVR